MERNRHLPVELDVPVVHSSANDLQTIPKRIIAVGVQPQVSLKHLHMYLSQYGEVKFCKVIPPSLQFNQLGDMSDYPDLKFYQHLRLTSTYRNFLVEFGEIDSLDLVCYMHHKILLSCHQLLSSTSIAEQIIKEAKDRTVFVFGMKKFVTEKHLQRLFTVKAGEVEACRIARNKQDLRSKGFGFLTFSDHRSMARLAEIDGILFEGKMLRWLKFCDKEKDSDLKPANIKPSNQAKSDLASD